MYHLLIFITNQTHHFIILTNFVLQFFPLILKYYNPISLSNDITLWIRNLMLVDMYSHVYTVFQNLLLNEVWNMKVKDQREN